MATLRTIFLSLVYLWCMLLSPTSIAQGNASDAEGLWRYTGLITRDGESLPLTGIFLISENTFLQQGIFNTEPFDSADSMAHVGPYWSGGAGLRLASFQTLSLDPGADSPIQSAGSMEHDLSVTRDGESLTLVFGGGTSTVQTFERVGDAKDTRLYRLQDGGLAFADDHFILVVGNDESVVSGYGRYRQQGAKLQLDVIRWAESDGTRVSNRRNLTLNANFDERELVLDDGRRFAVLD